MLHLCMSVRLVSVCIANASALFHEYGDSNSKYDISSKKHKQLPGLLYEVKTSLYAV